jgi:phosphoglycerol transferase
MTPRAYNRKPEFFISTKIVSKFSRYFAGFFFILLSIWLRRIFGEVTLEQILYHLKFGSDGILKADRIFFHSFINWCFLVPSGSSFVAVILEQTITYFRADITDKDAHPISPGWRIAPVFFIFSALTYCLHSVAGFEYIASNFGADYFSSHYIAPEKITLLSDKPKNLVLIYVESLEAGYADKGRFGTDLLSDIEGLGGISFQHYSPAPGTGWTIAAIIATQCGIPLKVVLAAHDGNSQGNDIKSFLPNATCLGDILASKGYQNIFMGGASLDFAGKGTFLHDHGYQNMYGREEWIKQGAETSNMNGWGLYDDDLFSNAKIKLQELHKTKQPFNLTVLTVDTHHPSGNFSKSCLKSGAKEFVDIVKCSSNQVAHLVRYMKKNDYLKDTNVVILGDHLAMVNPAWDQLNAGSGRFIFNSFVSAAPPKKNREDIVPFDLFPSILEFIGIEVQGDRLGLGFSGFYDSKLQPPPDRIAQMEQSLLNSSSAYFDFWDQRRPVKNPNHAPPKLVNQTTQFHSENQFSNLH